MTRKEIQSLELVERIKWRLTTKEIATKRREEVLIYIPLNCLRGVWKSEVPSCLTNDLLTFQESGNPKVLRLTRWEDVSVLEDLDKFSLLRESEISYR